MSSDREGSPVEDRQQSEKEPSPAKKVQSPQKGKTEKGMVYHLCSRRFDLKRTNCLVQGCQIQVTVGKT